MAFHAIKAGEGDVFISAGVETVSRFAKGTSDHWPDTQNPVFADAVDRTAKTAEGGVDWHDPREDGNIPDAYIAMGQTAENVAKLRGLTREELDRAYQRFKDVADRKKTVLPEEVVAIVEEDLAAPPRTWELRRFAVTTGSDREPSAVVTLTCGGVETERAAGGDGPVDAMFAAINGIVALAPALVDYTVRAVAGGTEAVGEAVVRIRLDHDLAVGRASSTDVLEASARAYVAAINKLLAGRAVPVAAGGHRA
jgi:acetyl-CoA acetyltransferase